MEKEIKFRHRVSKGSRYNQIYLPKEMQKHFHAGDLVEVRLLERKQEIFLHNVKLTEFKERLIKDIFKFLGKYVEIEQVFIFGSFLTEKTGYNDIDIFIITNREKDEKFDNIILSELLEEFNLKFHVISGVMEKLTENLKFSPPMRSMFSHFVSNNIFEVPKERIIDKNELLLTLMSPEDIIAEKDYFDRGRMYFNSLRILGVVERFLSSKEEDILEVYNEIKNIVGIKLFEELRKDESITRKDKEAVVKIIRTKLNKIKKRIK